VNLLLFVFQNCQNFLLGGPTLCLLKAYRDLEWKLSDPKIKNEAVWQEIAKLLSEHDCMFNAEKCERKMLNMKRDYRSVIDHNNKTGNDRKTHPYLDEMSELFGLKPCFIIVVNNTPIISFHI
jgi:hypothetical protein